jgi:hypothetical protein
MQNIKQILIILLRNKYIFIQYQILKEKIDTARIDTARMDTDTDKVIKTSVTRKTFEKACEHCNKVLKSASTYAKHVNTQTCFSKNEITYCKLCKITLSTHNEYTKHLLSLEHLNTIGCNKLEILNTNQPSTILQIDPYLSHNEAKRIGTNNLGGKFTLVYNNNQTQIIDLVEPETQNNNTHGDSNGGSIGDSSDNVQNVILEKKIEPNAKQLKIISILEQASTTDKARELLVKILDTKLQIEDYHGLQNIIKKNNNINEDIKLVYLDVLNKFVSLLVKKKNNGETIYKEQDISKIVIALTS